MATHLIVPVVSREPAALFAAGLVTEPALIELRVDLVADPAVVETLLGQSAVARRAILTIRRTDEGGAWDGDEDERISLYERLGLRHPAWIDVEFAAWQRSANIRQKLLLVAERPGSLPSTAGRPRSGLILSSHDLSGTPGDAALAARLGEIRAAGPAVAKIVTTARDGRDAVRILSLLAREAARGPLIALAMGPAGVLTRVLAPKFGAWGNFATFDSGTESAPGQLSLRELHDGFRYGSINAATRVFGVLGWPVAHSRSPLIHNGAMSHEGIDGVYVPIPVAPDREAFFEFMDRIAAEPALGFDGFSVTLPHKEHALAWLESRRLPLSPLARRCGAVNTLIRRAAGWCGENTDALGAWAAIEARRASAARPGTVDRDQALILGAGGVGRAVAAVLIDHGFDVCIANRSRERADALARELGCTAVDWHARGDVSPSLLVNCTSVGMWPDVDASPYPAAALRRGTLVFDTVYNPAETRLLRDAAAAGAVTISGVEMFLAQAAGQYELWHGRPAPLDVMRDSILRQSKGG